MSMDNNNSNFRVPKLRFSDFHEEWKEVKLGEIFEKNEERNRDGSIGYDKTISIASMTYKPSGNGAADDSLRTYKVLRVGDIAFEGHTSKDYAYGRFVMNDVGIGIMSPRFTALRPKSEIVVDFWAYLIHYEPIMRSLLLKSTKRGTMMNELIVADFLKQSLLIPSIAEQKRIAKSLLALDDYIYAQDKKIEFLKERKQGLMQQLFPQNGEAIPRLRFPGFTGEWEKRLFREITIPAGKKNRQNLPYERYSISNEIGFYPQGNQFEDGGGYLKDIDCRQYIIVAPKSFAYNPARINVGSIGYQDLGKEVIISSLYEVFQTKMDCDDAFLWQWFHTDVFHKMVINVQEGGVRQYFFYEKLKECSINLPSISEQKKIANCLSSFDKVINNEQNKADTLKTYKKGLLQQLFPNQ